MADLETELSELFGEHVTAEPVSEQSIAGATVVVCNMAYTKKSSDNYVKIRQTAMVLLADDLDLPEFALSPTATGLAGMVFARLGGFGDINFNDSPEFSKQYHLHGWVEEPVRVLFNPAIRKHFASQTGWNVRGKANRLVIFRHNKTCSPEHVETFVQDCLPIFELFQDGECELDNRPELRRQTEASDVMATADRMGGFVGARIQSQLRKVTVTQSDLREFERESPPRKIPAPIKRQVLGGNLPLIFIGLLFIVAGIGVGTAVLMTMQGPFRWMGIPMVAFMPLVGALMSVLTFLYRRKKARILRQGTLTKGRVVSVDRTENSVNNQSEHRVTITYSIRGVETTATCSAYSIAANKAREYESSGDEVKVLVDPTNPQNIVCTDLLVVDGLVCYSYPALKTDRRGFSK